MQACQHSSIGWIPKRQRQQLDESFDQAKAKLGSQSGQGPFVLASKLPQSVFDAWMTTARRHGIHSIQFVDSVDIEVRRHGLGARILARLLPSRSPNPTFAAVDEHSWIVI